MALYIPTREICMEETEPARSQPMTPYSSYLNAFTSNQAIVRPAEYIGSFMVTGKGHNDRAEIVRQKLEAARLYTRSKAVVLFISLNGIKVCRDNDQHVYMAHALRRISYATCDPEHVQFAFLAREPRAEPNIQYCHAFVTGSPDKAEELNNIVGEAFRVAYARQQMLALTGQMRRAPSIDGTPVNAPLSHGTPPPPPLPTDLQSAASPRALNRNSLQPDPLTGLLPAAIQNGDGPVGVLSGAPPAVPAITTSPLRTAVHTTTTAIPLSTCPIEAAVLNKPLPPVPQYTGLERCSPIIQSNPVIVPLSAPTALELDDAAAAEVGHHRASKPQKHHKHHRHRHRHRAKDVAAQTSDTLNNDSLSTDSGRHTGTGESVPYYPPGITSSPHAFASAIISVPPPPPPPPRGPSSVLSSDPTSSPTKASRKLDPQALASGGSLDKPIDGSLPSVCCELQDGNIARPSSQISRPQSQHSYDMPDHRSCGALSSSSVADELSITSISSNINVAHTDTTTSAVTSLTTTPQPLILNNNLAGASFVPRTSPQAAVASTATASSSTTGCGSTATSGSARSGTGSDNSLRAVGPPLPPMLLPRHSCSALGDNGSPHHSGGHTSGSGGRSDTLDSLEFYPPPPAPRRHSMRAPDPYATSPPPPGPSESLELANAPWYQPSVPREVVLETLARLQPGSFVIRDSGSHANCYALSVRSGDTHSSSSANSSTAAAANHRRRCAGVQQQQQHAPSHSGPGTPGRTSGLAAYPACAGLGISHFLIQRTTRGGVRLKGLDKEWPSLACLVLHLTVMPEMLPCPLRLPKAAANPAFSPLDPSGDGGGPASALAAHFHPIHDPIAPSHGGGGGGLAACTEVTDVWPTESDEDYQRLSDFSSIMADLKMQPPVKSRAGASRKIR